MAEMDVALDDLILTAHAEDDRAEEGADRRAVAAGQEAAADDRRDDRLGTRGLCRRR